MKFDIDARAGSSSTPLPQTRSAVTANNPERLAWLVIWGAFAACLLFSVSLPLAARQFILYTLEPRPSQLQAINLTQAGCGTVRFTPPNAVQPTAVTCDPAPFSEGSAIETDQTSRAFISFFEGSTAQIYNDARLVTREMRQPRFSWSALPNRIQIDQERGLVLYAVAPALVHPGNPDGRSVALDIHTRDFDAGLTEGSYSIEVNDQGSQIIVRSGGPATVRSKDGTREMAVSQGQRIQVAAGAIPPAPLPAAQDLVTDGSFTADLLTPAWQSFFDQGGDGGDVDGKLDLMTVDGRRSLHILRQDAGTNSAVTGVRQTLNRDVSYFTKLIFSADVRLHFQSLSGGGYQSSEYPLIIRLKYRDVNGNEHDTIQGFYYQNTDENPTRGGEPIPVDKWIPYQTGNLLQMLDPKPFYLVFIELYASGWDYDSNISTVRLTVE